MNILTFNWHAPYIYLLSKLGHRFLVVEPELAPGIVKHWEKEMRPLPENVRLLPADKAKAELDEGRVDLVIAHNIKDLIFVHGYQTPKIMVYHNRLSTEIGLSNTVIDRGDYLRRIDFLRQDVKEIYISESKRRDWGGSGPIVLPGIDISELGGYTGQEPAILRVGNHFKERDLMLGYSMSQQITAGLPCVTLGINPSIPDAKVSRDYADLKAHFRRCRLYLNTTVDQYEDGYNLSMLEAMATGMPVISIANQSSPIIDGVNGFISNDIEYLRRQATMLLNDPEKARAMGEKARQTVAEQFGLAAFLGKWEKIIQEALREFLQNNGVSVDGAAPMPFHEKKKKNILMDYVSYPPTTAYYMERALRKFNNVVTCGAMINDEVRKLWKLENLNWPVYPQEIARYGDEPVLEVMRQLPPRWTPDLYFWVETSLDRLPRDLDALTIPKACYLIDTHLHLQDHIELARRFDFVFLAQREYLPEFNKAGCAKVYWLPLACDAEIHGKTDVEKKYDVGFVGSMNGTRQILLEEIGRHCTLFADRRFMDEMAAVYSQSRMVFNIAIKNDLNMRVFEGLCSGSMLLTDAAAGSGLTEMFQDGEELVVYRDVPDLLAKICYYLDHPEARECIAAKGRAKVLEKHTYEHRARTMIEIMENHLKGLASGGADTSVGHAQPVGGFADYDVAEMVRLVPEQARVVLVAGSDAAGIGRELKKRSRVFVAGIAPAATPGAVAELDDFAVGDISTAKYVEKSFDCILLTDVMDYIGDPISTLSSLKKYLKGKGVLLVAFRHAGFFTVVRDLVESNWEEVSTDEKNQQYFTLREIQRVMTAAGLSMQATHESVHPQYRAFEGTGNNVLTMGRLAIRDLSREEIHRFFVSHYIISATESAAVKTETDSGWAGERLLAAMQEEARGLEKARNYDKALEVYHLLMSEFPGRPEGAAGMGNCYMHKQDLDAAHACYCRALKIDPLFAEGILGMGLVSISYGQYATAIEAFNLILTMEPENDRALCGLGIAYNQSGDKIKAMEYLSRCLNVNMENKGAMPLFLRLSYDLSRFDEVIVFLNRYVNTHPGDVNTLYALAGVYFTSGRQARAREILECILEKDPSYGYARELLERIESTRLSTVNH